MRSIANTMLQESYLACWDAEGLSWSLCARIWNDWHWWGKLQHYSLARGLLRVFLTSLWHFHNPSLHIHGKATRSHVLRAPWSTSVGNPWGPKAEADKEHLAPQPLPGPCASPAAAGKAAQGDHRWGRKGCWRRVFWNLKWLLTGLCWWLQIAGLVFTLGSLSFRHITVYSSALVSYWVCIKVFISLNITCILF